MPDLRISALTAGSSLLATDEVPVNEAGTTKKVTGLQIWQSAVDPYTVKAYGCKGDGITDDSANLVTACAAPGTYGGEVRFQPGVYITKTTITPKSNVAYTAIPGTVTLKRNVTGDVFGKVATSGALTNCSWIGLNFDLTVTAWSAIDIGGDDAHGQLSNILIRDCQFKNPSITWMIQITYAIVDPAIPTFKNQRIRIEDCLDDATGQTFTLENLIIVNSTDVLISGCSFLNAPATLNSHVAIYGYNNNVRLLGNYTSNWLSTRCLYIQQSQNVVVMGDQYFNTNDTNEITVFDSKDVSVIGCTGTLPAAGAGAHVAIIDHGGTTFDAHTNQYNQSKNIRVQTCRFDGGSYSTELAMTNAQGQTDIFVEGCMVSPLRSLFLTTGMPAAPSASVKKLHIKNNHVITHSGFSGGVACVEINGNASAALGGFSGIVIQDNYFPVSGGGGTGTDIEIQNLADDVTIQGNRHLGSATPIVFPVATTKLRIFNNPGYDQGIGGIGIRAFPTPLTGQTAAVASVAAATVMNDGAKHLYRISGSVLITTLGSGNINLQVVYTDQSNTARTCNIPLCATAGGVFVASATTADDYKGSVLICCFPNTAITVKTAGTFTTCTYAVWGSIEQLG